MWNKVEKKKNVNFSLKQIKQTFLEGESPNLIFMVASLNINVTVLFCSIGATIMNVS